MFFYVLFFARNSRSYGENKTRISFQDFNSPQRFSNREESLGPAPDVWTDLDSEKKRRIREKKTRIRNIVSYDNYCMYCLCVKVAVSRWSVYRSRSPWPQSSRASRRRCDEHPPASNQNQVPIKTVRLRVAVPVSKLRN